MPMVMSPADIIVDRGAREFGAGCMLGRGRRSGRDRPGSAALVTVTVSKVSVGKVWMKAG